MSTSSCRSIRLCLRLLRPALLGLLAACPVAYAQWTQPTPEELSMTSQAEVPGAPAVYLFREETSEDNLHMYSVYVRLKVLSEAGREQANVELSYRTGSDFHVDSIAGRTIQPDGRITSFTGKPFQKLISKSGDTRYMATLFTMPDVEVGSILEYRYKLRWDDSHYMSPEWLLQSKFFTRSAHFQWKPTNTRTLVNGKGQLVNTIAWAAILPDGAHVERTELPKIGLHDPQSTFDLVAHHVPPVPQDDYMPPISAFTYRVQFYYTPFRSGEEFWRNEGNSWAKQENKAIGPGHGVQEAVSRLIAPSDAPDVKLHKLYAAVQQLDNTDFSRQHSHNENQAQGLRDARNTDDVLVQQRGSGDQLTELFIAMARAAGFRAYPMIVTNRDQRIFFSSYLSFNQFDDLLAIVNVDGKDLFFDPGSRFCNYGQLAWKHTLVTGVRAVDGGSVISNTPAASYTASRVQRVANLTMDREGAIHGVITLTYIGSPALYWREQALLGDDASISHDLEQSLEQLLPSSIVVKFASVSKLTDYEQPLVATFNVSGRPGNSTGKRLILPSDLFESNTKATFPHEKREVAVYFEYPQLVQDALRINFPPGFAIESMPKSEKVQYNKDAGYEMTTQSTPSSYTLRRNFILGEIIYPAKNYTELRSFYNKLETIDQESLVLKLPSSASPSDSPTSGASAQ